MTLFCVHSKHVQCDNFDWQLWVRVSVGSPKVTSHSKKRKTNNGVDGQLRQRSIIVLARDNCCSSRQQTNQQIQAFFETWLHASNISLIRLHSFKNQSSKNVQRYNKFGRLIIEETSQLRVRQKCNQSLLSTVWRILTQFRA